MFEAQYKCQVIIIIIIISMYNTEDLHLNELCTHLHIHTHTVLLLLLLGMNNSELITQLQRGYRHPRPRQCSDELYEIMMQCWKEEPVERPTFAHLFNTMNDFNVSMERGYADSA